MFVGFHDGEQRRRDHVVTRVSRSKASREGLGDIPPIMRFASPAALSHSQETPTASGGVGQASVGPASGLHCCTGIILAPANHHTTRGDFLNEF